ncbi:MAG: cytochrome c [Gemmatimonadota bacterium]|nr:cytochrome c [Gemmatimonadota bacterium]
MARVLKLVGIVVGAVVLLAAVGAAALYAWTGAELGKKVALPTHEFRAPTDAASVARGEHVVRALVKCGECHGADLGGQPVVDDPAIGRVVATNITRGQGGVLATYSDADLERAIRHGLAKDGRRLVVMPSNEYQFISDEDLGAVIAYLRTVPPVDREVGPQKVGPLARALFAAGKFPLFPGTEVTHLQAPVPSVPVDSTVAYGKYIGDIGCSGCHGRTYGGGAIPGGPPEWPKPANLTPEGIGHYSLADFEHILRTGTRPDGSKLDPFMPIGATSLMTPVEVTAVFRYLQSLPPKPFGTR